MSVPARRSRGAAGGLSPEVARVSRSRTRTSAASARCRRARDRRAAFAVLALEVLEMASWCWDGRLERLAQRPRQPVPRNPLHGAPGRRRWGYVGGLPRGLLRRPLGESEIGLHKTELIGPRPLEDPPHGPSGRFIALSSRREVRNQRSRHGPYPVVSGGIAWPARCVTRSWLL
jgi:hypothetical protein